MRSLQLLISTAVALLFTASSRLFYNNVTGNFRYLNGLFLFNQNCYVVFVVAFE